MSFTRKFPLQGVSFFTWRRISRHKTVVVTTALVLVGALPLTIEAIQDEQLPTTPTANPLFSETTNALPAADSSSSDNTEQQNSASSLSASITASSNNEPEVNVSINGQEVDVPESGTVQKNITSNGSTTNVRINIDNNEDSNSSSVRLRTSSTTTNDTSTRSSVNITSKE